MTYPNHYSNAISTWGTSAVTHQQKYIWPTNGCHFINNKTDFVPFPILSLKKKSLTKYYVTFSGTFKCIIWNQSFCTLVKTASIHTQYRWPWSLHLQWQLMKLSQIHTQNVRLKSTHIYCCTAKFYCCPTQILFKLVTWIFHWPTESCLVWKWLVCELHLMHCYTIDSRPSFLLNVADKC